MSQPIRFERTIRKLFCEPWLITPQMHRVIADVFSDHFDRRQRQAGIEDLFEPVESPKMEVENGVGIIPVRGVISREISSMERISGAVDVNEISQMLHEAEGSADVSAVVFDMDSPGGGVEGVEELSDEIAAMKKPSIAHTAGLMASAAYWIGSAADLIYASGSATVGSIGVYMAMLDTSRQYENAGIYVDLIKSKKTPYKGAGMRGTSLSEDQREDFQASVDYLYERFSGAVKRNRKMADESAMDGRTFFGSQGVEMGLIDAVASRAKAIEDAGRMARLRR